MSQENVEAVRRVGRAMNDGDEQAVFRLLHPDIEWVVAKEHPNARTVIGLEALVEYLRDWRDTLPDVRFEIDRAVGADDRVVAIGVVRGTGIGSEAEARVPLAIVYTLRDGLIVRAEEYLNPAEALKAVGLEE